MTRSGIKRILLEVDEERLGYAVQKRLSLHDDMSWFIQVTRDVYWCATYRELQNHGMSGPCKKPCFTNDDLENALDQVFSVRGKAFREQDLEMISFMSSLLHVKHDHAFPCPVALGSPLPSQRIDLFPLTKVESGCRFNAAGLPLPSISLSNLISRRPRPLVVIAGSWT